MKNEQPENLLEAIRYFSDPDVCVAFVASLRWPDGPACPSCEGTQHSYLKTRRIWKCKGCKRQFSVKIGTIFEDSPIGFDKWLPAIWLIANSKNGISSHELARALGVTQKTGWFMLHRIRLAMQTGSFAKFSGEVEVDETFIGGKARNMHANTRARKISGTGGKDKTAVLGAKMRGGRVHALVVPDRKRATLDSRVRDLVAPGAAVYTDALPSYSSLSDEYVHRVVDHAVQYVDGRVHTNQIEGFWALLKRGLKGTYVQVAPYHLFRYLDERCFTFNEREQDDFGRFATVLVGVSGQRLTYERLTGKT